MTWRCAACQQDNPAGTRFCGHCGHPAAEGAAAEVTVEPTVAPAADIAAFAEPGPESPAVDRGEERRLITVIFADISGFTPLADRLDPEEVQAAVNPILERMAAIIGRYDGHVHQYAGDAVIAYFGAPVAHEDDALRALMAARDMHHEVAEVVASLPAEVAHVKLHIGVNTGHVVTGYRRGGVRLDYYALGDAVNTAQRLEAACPVGEVYVGDLTRRLVGPALAFESVGDLVMKGKPEPVPAWRLVVGTTANTLPSDGTGSPDGTGPTGGAESIFGRDTEIATIDAALAEARAGAAVVLGIVGEPGIGKSRLLQETRRQAELAGSTWVSTRCLSYGATLAYRPYLELVRNLAGVQVGDAPEHVRAQVTAIADELAVSAHLQYLLSVAGLTVPEMPAAIRDNAQALRMRVQEALVALLLALAERGRLVLTIEDLHWMDSASLDVTALVLSRARSLCLVATARPEGLAAFRRLADEVGDHRLIQLETLSPTAARALAQAIVGGPIDPATMDHVLTRTGGNALFVQEVVRALVDAGALRSGKSGWALARDGAADVPSTLESVLAARIDLLPIAAADVLQIAAVIGRDVRLPLLRGLVPMSDNALEDIVDLLVTRQFLDRVVEGHERRVVFHHALVADVAYGRLLRRRRRELHRRLLEVALRLYGSGDDSIDLLARNAYLGGMGAAALPYLVPAADRAISLFANSQAVTLLQQSLEIAEAEAPARLPELLSKLGSVQERTGAFESALECYRRVRMLTGDVDATLDEARVLYRVDGSPEATELLDTMRVDDLSVEQQVSLAHLRGRIIMISGDTRRAIAVLSAALDHLVSSGHGGSTLEAELLTVRGRCYGVVDDNDAAFADLDRAQAILERVGNLPLLATALRVLGGVRTEVGDPEAGLDTLRHALEVARQVGHAEEIGASSLNIGWGFSEQGRLEEALVYTDEARAAFASIGIVSGVANAIVNRCDILTDLGRLDEAREEAMTALELAREASHHRWVIGALACLGEVALRQQDYVSAIGHFGEAVQGCEVLGDEGHAAMWGAKLDQARASLAAAT